MPQDHIPAFTLEPRKRPAAKKETSAPRTPRFIDDIAAGHVKLPAIPRVVQRLIAALRDPDADFRRIGDALSADPILSAKVLRMANSSIFGGQRSVASIDAAVAAIGIVALNRLIVSCGVASSFKEVPGIDLRIFWRDALVAAIAANKLAPRLAADPEEAYVCGLLHATGHLILCHTYPDIANAIFTGFAVVRGAELAAIEMDTFGIDHPTVGALWVESMGFPQPISDTIGNTVRPLADPPRPLDVAVHGACALAAAVAQKDAADKALSALPPVLRAQFPAANGKANAAFGKFYDELLKIESMF